MQGSRYMQGTKYMQCTKYMQVTKFIKSQNTGWPRKNTTLTINNFKKTKDRMEKLFALLRIKFFSQQDDMARHKGINYLCSRRQKYSTKYYLYANKLNICIQ